MTKPHAHVSAKKKAIVKELMTLFSTSPVIGLVNMENLPAAQLQKMKSSLRGKVDIRMTKRRLITLAMQNGHKDGYDALIKRMDGIQPGLIFTKENPFKLYKLLKASKSPAAAKAGQKAPRDIIVPAGKTPFGPGPIIGELGQLGIKAGIEEGKVAIKQEKLLVPEGEVFSAKAAEMLTRLNILPMEVGLNIVCVWENGAIFDSKLLDIDEKVFLADLQRMHVEALNLGVFVGYPTKDTIALLITRAHRDASGLADSKDILTSDNVKRLLAKADAQAQSLKTKGNL